MSDKTDFFKESPETKIEGGKEVEVEKEVEKVKVGGDEYTQEELDSLVKLGKVGREAEEKYNTKIDKVWPEFTKKSQALKEAEEKLKSIDKPEAPQTQEPAAPETDEQKVAADILAQAEKLGIATNKGVEELVAQKVVQHLQAKDMLDDCKKLEGELDGEDGKPKFSTEEVLKYMDESGIKNPRDAYDIKYKEEVAEWERNKLEKAKKKGVDTIEASSAGSKTPKPVKVNKGNLESLVRAGLKGEL